MKRIHLMIIVLISVSALSAAVVNVPEDAATIQAGIDVANAGDTVLVSPGTYVENINFNGNNITVQSMYGPELTIIDGNENGSVVLFLTQEEVTAVLDGFTITNGTGWNNGDEFVGGGIACRESSHPTMKNLIVTDNSAIGGEDPAGGGITIARNSHPSLENIEISHNESAWGGGLAIAYDCNPTLKHVEIHHNQSSITGGGVYIGVGSSPYFQDTFVHDNHASYYGGGFFLHDHVTPTFNEMTVRGNRGSTGGGGMITNHGSKPIIINSIFHGNIPDQILYNSDTDYLPDTVSIAYSNIQGSQAGINIGPGVLNWLEGNVATDPCFTGPSDELQAHSTCIDSGAAFFAYEGETWIDMAADEYVGSAPDMGSFEFRAPIVYTVPGSFNTIQAAIDASVDGDIVRVDIGTYVENIDFKGKNITVESMGGPELTIIDGNESGAGVLFLNQEKETAVLDGFTITNGTGMDNGDEIVGGGIACRLGSSPTLMNLIVTGNTALGGEDPAGGGITIARYCNPRLENVEISDNESVWGGGLAIAYDSHPTLKQVDIHHNDASTTGGGVYIGVNASPYFEDVYVHNNHATYYGGGFFLHDAVTPTFNKITVRDNMAASGGGGLITNHGSKPSIINSIFYGNFPDQIFYNSDAQYLPDTVMVAYSDIQGGETGINVGPGLLHWETGNIQLNPQFSGAGDELNPASPCVDAGTAVFTYEGVTYVNMADDEYVGAAPDMGCWEMPVPQTLLVPQNYASIQLGIEAAVDGDTVLVDDGTYYENIDFLGKNIVVTSANGELVTTIDGGALDATVKFMSQEATAILDGFTITNGSGFMNLGGHRVGGGIACRFTSTPTLRNLIVEHNNALGDTSMGGGIICSHDADAIIEDVIIRNNEADYGGGFIAFEADPSLTRVKIYENYGRVTGGGLVLWTSDAHVEQTLVVQNNAEYVGAGVWVHLGGNPTLDRVTIAHNNTNKAITWGAKGAGIGISDGSTLELISSIVWGNTNRNLIANNIEFYHINAANSIAINFSDVEGGQAGILDHDNGTITWTPTNIVDDPIFVDPGVLDYNLQSVSPCIGTGMLAVDMGAGSECMTLATDQDLVLVPQQFELYQNYPNPFNPSTTINFELPDAGWVTLVVYDITGREVATLMNGQGLGGRHSMTWVANNQEGKPLGTGIYLYEMKYTNSQGKHFREVRKFTLLK